ncbi:MAG TPA: hypothetical protein VG838_15700 [Opitutaceae bacterium]|nr:hypothetical protein [Opitutaceae bacterium]
MPITYTIDREKRLIHETWTGEIRAADLAAYWKRYLADPEVLEIRRTIVDLRGCVIRFRGADMDSLIQTVVLPVLKDRKWTTAIVVGEPAQFGVSRQYQVFADRYSEDSIFGNMADAEKWISSLSS